MFRSIIAATILATSSIAFVPAAHADIFPRDADAGQVASEVENSAVDPADQLASGQDRLMIVNRNTRHVIYDDGRNDLFCATQRYLVGYTYYGRPIFHRSMHCR